MKTAMLTLMVLGSSAIIAASTIENPQAELNNIIGIVSDWLTQNYDKIINEEYSRVAGAIISSVVTALTWVSVLVMIGLIKARNAAKDILEKTIATDKPKEPSEFSVTHQIIFNESQESEVVSKAKARTLYQQLKHDVEDLEAHIKWLPEEIDDAKDQLDHKRRLVLAHKQDYNRACDQEAEASEKYTKLKNDLERELLEIAKINKEIERLKELI